MAGTKASAAPDPCKRRLERVELGLERILPLVLDRPGANHQGAAAARTDLLRHGRLVVFREVPRLAGVGERTRPVALALLQAAQTRRRVGDEARLAHLAVVDDIDAGGDLLAHGVAHRLPHALGVGLLVDRLAVHPRQHQLEQVLRTRQAADVRGQDAIGAQFHISIPVVVSVAARSFRAQAPAPGRRRNCRTCAPRRPSRPSAFPRTRRDCGTRGRRHQTQCGRQATRGRGCAPP